MVSLADICNYWAAWNCPLRASQVTLLSAQMLPSMLSLFRLPQITPLSPSAAPISSDLITAHPSWHNIFSLFMICLLHWNKALDYFCLMHTRFLGSIPEQMNHTLPLKITFVTSRTTTTK